MKVCRICGAAPARKGLCKVHRKAYDKQYYTQHAAEKAASATQRKRELLDWYRSLKTGKACFDCGGIFHFAAMDFDHVEGHVKKDEISHMVRVGMSKEKILEEIAKTVLLCANCHRVRTFNGLKGKRYAI